MAASRLSRMERLPLLREIAVGGRGAKHRRDVLVPIARDPRPDRRDLEFQFWVTLRKEHEVKDMAADRKKGERTKPLVLGGDRVAIALQPHPLTEDRPVAFVSEQSRAL